MELLGRSREQVRQYLERHIFESAGRAVPKLEHICTVEKVRKLGYIIGIESLSVVSVVYAVSYLSLGKIGKELAEYEFCARTVILLAQFFQIFHADRGYLFGNEKSAVYRNALCYRLCRGNFYLAVSGALVIHKNSPF